MWLSPGTGFLRETVKSSFLEMLRGHQDTVVCSRGGPCLSRGLDHLQQSHPTSSILWFILSNGSMLFLLWYTSAAFVPSLCSLNCGTVALPLMLSFLFSVALWLPTVVTAIMMRTYWKEWRMRRRSWLTGRRWLVCCVEGSSQTKMLWFVTSSCLTCTR